VLVNVTSSQTVATLSIYFLASSDRSVSAGSSCSARASSDVGTSWVHIILNMHLRRKWERIRVSAGGMASASQQVYEVEMQ
jgi:hypothetical protein